MSLRTEPTHSEVVKARARPRRAKSRTPVPAACAYFPIEEVLQAVATAIKPYPKAAMFALAEQGWTTVFAQLIACIISVRTRDETTIPAALALLQKAPDAAAMAALSESQIAHLISDSTFAHQKAKNIRAIAERTLSEFHGVLPCDTEILQSFGGVGPKCAHLALGVACGEARISVDIHVHRIVNRWGYVSAPTPEKTMLALMAALPKQHWIRINSLLVPFGKHICTGHAPHCSTCPVNAQCQKRGLTQHR